MFVPLSRRCRFLGRPSIPTKHVFSRPLSAAAAAKPPLNIVLVGAPGVGKGTYAKHMAPYLNITHVSTGDLVREYAKRDYDSFKKILAAGELVPDHEITRLLQERLNDPATASGVLLDGYPRNLEQVDLLDKFMDVTSVLHISLREDVLVRKCCARRMCPKCGENYNIAHIIEGTMNMPAIAPKKEGICDKCSTPLQQRPDDVESVVRKRLELYKEVTHPIVQKYADRGQLITFELTSGVAEMLPKFIALCDEKWVHLAHRSPSKATRPASGSSRPGTSTPIQSAPQTERKASIKL